MGSDAQLLLALLGRLTSSAAAEAVLLDCKDVSPLHLQGAGTDAQVLLELHGAEEGKQSGEFLLQQGPAQQTPFCRGQTDAFEVGGRHLLCWGAMRQAWHSCADRHTSVSTLFAWKATTAYLPAV